MRSQSVMKLCQIKSRSSLPNFFTVATMLCSFVAVQAQTHEKPFSEETAIQEEAAPESTTEPTVSRTLELPSQCFEYKRLAIELRGEATTLKPALRDLKTAGDLEDQLSRFAGKALNLETKMAQLKSRKWFREKALREMNEAEKAYQEVSTVFEKISARYLKLRKRIKEATGQDPSNSASIYSFIPNFSAQDAIRTNSLVTQNLPEEARKRVPTDSFVAESFENDGWIFDGLNLYNDEGKINLTKQWWGDHFHIKTTPKVSSIIQKLRTNRRSCQILAGREALEQMQTEAKASLTASNR